MKLGETIIHNGIEAILVEEQEEDSCKGCIFDYYNRPCTTPEDIVCDGGIFIKLEETK